MNFDSTILNALLPIFIIILLGWILRHRGVPGEGFWSQAERLTYFLLFPALLLKSTAEAHYSADTALTLIVVVVATTVGMTILVLFLRPLVRSGGPGFSSLFQGSIRFNTYVGLALVFALYGQEGLGWAAVTISFLIPLVNLLCILVLTHFGHGEKGGPVWIVQQLIRNPLIIACLLGIGLNLSGIGLPLGSDRVVEILARAALPLGLLAVGAGLDLKALHGAKRDVVLVSVIKLLLFPMVMALACHASGVSGVTAGVLVIFAALPTAPTAYILARQLGGDGPLMANIITLQTLFAAVTLALVMGLLLPLVG